MTQESGITDHSAIVTNKFKAQDSQSEISTDGNLVRVVKTSSKIIRLTAVKSVVE